MGLFDSLRINRRPVNTRKVSTRQDEKLMGAFDQLKLMFGLMYDRIIMYSDFEYMLQDAIISSAVELYVEDATQASPETKKPFWISTTNEFLQTEFLEFVQRLDLEKNYTDIAYNLCLYGDQFPRLYWGNTSEGLLYMDHRIHPADIEKAALGGYTLGYRYDNRIFTAKDFYHLKLCFSRVQRREMYNWMIIKVDGFDFRVRSDYGTSILENARKIYKVLNLLENCLIIGRMARSPLNQIIGVQFGDKCTNEEAMEFINMLKEATCENNTIDLLTNTFENAKESFQIMKRLFIPLFGEKGTLQIDTMGGNVDIKDIVDIEYFQSKLYGALRVPKAYLGMEESLPGSLGESALARLEIRYAKNVLRVRNSMLQFIADLFTMHLLHIGKGSLVNSFVIDGAAITPTEDEERKNAMQTSMSISKDLLDTMQNMELIGEDKAEKQRVLTVLNKLFTKIPGFGELFAAVEKKENEIKDQRAFKFFQSNEMFWHKAESFIRSGMAEVMLNSSTPMPVEQALEVCRSKFIKGGRGEGQRISG